MQKSFFASAGFLDASLTAPAISDSEESEIVPRSVCAQLGLRTMVEATSATFSPSLARRHVSATVTSSWGDRTDYSTYKRTFLTSEKPLDSAAQDANCGHCVCSFQRTLQHGPVHYYSHQFLRAALDSLQ